LSKFLKRYIDTIFIMLGTSCNLHCRYCLQQCQEIPKLPDKINPDIFDFIKECCDENDGEPVGLHFYGGEPTIYFDKIKEVVEKTKDMNVGYSMITNGKAITKEMADFMNEHKFSVAISWDGPNVMKTRKYDAFKENFDNIMSLNSLGINAIISAAAYPKEVIDAMNELDAKYAKIHHGRHMSPNTEYIFDTGIADKSLIKEIDYDRVRQESYELTKAYIHAKENGEGDLPQYRWQANFFYSISHFYSGDCPETTEVTHASCGNGYNVLDMDLSGNLYECHNIFESIGDIYTPYFDYLSQVISRDNLIGTHKDCNDCPAVSVCYGGCKLLKRGSKEKESYCAIRKALFGGMLDAYIEYGQQKHKTADENQEEKEDKSQKD